MSDQFARPFNLRITDMDGARNLHGVQFPSGRVVTDDPDVGLAIAAVSVESLLERFDGTPESAVVIWPEETEQP